VKSLALKIKKGKVNSEAATGFLYKYLPMTAKHHWDTLEQSYWYFSHRDQFNDPFDFSVRWTFDEKMYVKARNRLISKLSGDYGKILASIPPGTNIRSKLAISDLVALIRFHRLLSDNEIFDALGNGEIAKGIQSFVDEIGILCLTERPDDPLMWAHYSNSHQGICVGYDLELLSNREQPPNPIGQGKVRYSRWPVGAIDAYKAAEKLIDMNKKVEECLTTKNICWSYEKEVRLILWNGSKQKIQVDKDGVKEIVFGLRTTESDKSRIKGIYGSTVRYKQSWVCLNQHKLLLADI